MKVICTQENLNKALSVVSKVTNKNLTLPILNNVLLKTEKNGLKLSTTNLELGVSYWIGGKVEEAGEITVPTRLFANFISNLPGENVEIKTREDVLNIKCDGYKTNIKGIDAKEYPLTPQLEIEHLFRIPSSDFKYALAQVLPAVSLSESRLEITGVLMDFSQIKKGKLVLVATDSYRLAKKTVTLDPKEVNTATLDVLADIKSVIIPKNAVSALARDLGEGDEILEVVVTESQILFKFGSASILSRLIEGRYPDYTSVIPEKFLSRVIISTQTLAHAVKIASFFSNALNNSVKFNLTANGKLEVSSETNELGSNSSRLEAEVSGKALEVVYNYKYLMDGINCIAGEKGILDANDQNSPSLLRDGADESFVYVVMPIRG